MRNENSVYGSLFEAVRHTVYKTSAYRWPVIGYMADLNATKIDELKEFYNAFYAPNNAVVVIAGDVSASQVKKLVNKYYASIKRQELPNVNLTPEVLQRAPRFSTIEKDVQGVTLAVVYPGVAVGSADAHALDLMTSALGSGPLADFINVLFTKANWLQMCQCRAATTSCLVRFLFMSL